MLPSLKCKKGTTLCSLEIEDEWLQILTQTYQSQNVQENGSKG